MPPPVCVDVILYQGSGVRAKRPKEVSVQNRGAEEAPVGATLVVALLAYHQHRGWPIGLGMHLWCTPNIGVGQPGDHKGRPYRGIFATPILNAYTRSMGKVGRLPCHSDCSLD